MKKITFNLFSILFLLLSTFGFSQGKISGTVIDSELNSALPGVNVVVKGTAAGTTTDFDGKFLLNAATSTGQISISYIGYKSVSVDFTVKNGETINLGTITLQPDSNQLEEVVIKSTVIDVAKDRKTPVAVSTIKASEIQQKLGNQEFPEILANTPSVYTSKSGGGFGDSRVTIRGFSQENIAVMINGVPVNDMENSRVFWSNWAGLSDVTSAMQVQRGLGSSKLAISSVGGTINVVTRSADMKQGGLVSAGVANNDYLKTQVSYSTGKMKNGLSASVLLSQTMGDGYVDGTKFSGANYFIALGYEFNKKHDVQFTFTGAPQWHNQRSTFIKIDEYLKYSENGDPNVKYNADWGYLNGEEYNFRTNYYHKPVASLNWDFKISDKTKLSTVAYASWGRGGGTNGTGAIKGKRFSDLTAFRNSNGILDVDRIYAYNSGSEISYLNGTTPATGTRTLVNGLFLNNTSSSNNTTNGISKIASINSHDWYGGVANLNTKLTDRLTLDFGVDVRTYTGIHYQNVNDLLGANAFLDNTPNANGVASNGNINDPNRILYGTYEATPSFNPLFNVDHQQKVSYNNDGNVNWLGAFTQLEYSTGNLTAFIQGAVSQQGFKRVDYFKYLQTDALASTDYKNILGGNVKGGVNYNINKNHNVFVNAGYYSKQPFFNAVYPNNASIVNENITNEKVVGLEAGYGFRSSKFNANLNVYRTSWKDRFLRLTSNIDHDLNTTTPTIAGSAFLSGVEQIHTGVEIDFTYKPIKRIALNGMVSIGDWKYGSNVTANYQDDNNVVITNPSTQATYSETLYLDGLKVGDAAQTTASLGATFEVLERLKLDGNYRFVDNLYAGIDPTNFKTQATNDKGSLQLPAYGLADAGLSYKMLVGKDKTNSVNFRLNVNNVLDKTYIAESKTNIHVKNQGDYVNTDGTPNTTAYNTYLTNLKLYDGLDQTNQVYFGFGRTWNFGISYSF